MNPDFAIVLNYQLKNKDNFDPDFLVKTARDIGARAVSGSKKLKAACQKYTIFLAPVKDGQNLTADNVIQTLAVNRKAGQRTIINIPIDDKGQFSADTLHLLRTINSWMHMFGHAFNEGQPSQLTATHNAFVLENRHANYQKYVFLKEPLPQEVTVSGLKKEPNRVEWIENRKNLAFEFKDGKLKITLINPDYSFPWQVLRIQAHRPEDDIKETKF